MIVLVLCFKFISGQNCLSQNLFSESQGEISSHQNYGAGQYENNLNCNYTIVAGFDDSVEVQIVELDVENQNACNFDKLIMRVVNSEQEQTICGNNINDVRFANPFVGQGPIELIFTSDTSERANGFLVRKTFYYIIHFENFILGYEGLISRNQVNTIVDVLKKLYDNSTRPMLAKSM